MLTITIHLNEEDTILINERGEIIPSGITLEQTNEALAEARALLGAPQGTEAATLGVMERLAGVFERTEKRDLGGVARSGGRALVSLCVAHWSTWDSWSACRPQLSTPLIVWIVRLPCPPWRSTMTINALASSLYGAYAAAYSDMKGIPATAWASLGEGSRALWIGTAQVMHDSVQDDAAFAAGVKAGLAAAAGAVEASAQKYSEDNKRRVMIGHAAILKVDAHWVAMASTEAAA